MVRNNKGGKNGKKLARKHVKTEQGDGPKKVRVPEQEGEMFACATKMLGNATVLVVDLSGQEYLCIIRKKFKGRGKRGNTIQKGTWLLVGSRGFEASSGKKTKCDLLEVYNDKEKQLLKQQCPDCNWGCFDGYTDEVIDNVIHDDIEFINKQCDYQEMLEVISDEEKDSENDDIDNDDYFNTI